MKKRSASSLDGLRKAEDAIMAEAEEETTTAVAAAAAADAATTMETGKTTSNEDEGDEVMTGSEDMETDAWQGFLPGLDEEKRNSIIHDLCTAYTTAKAAHSDAKWKTRPSSFKAGILFHYYELISSESLDENASLKALKILESGVPPPGRDSNAVATADLETKKTAFKIPYIKHEDDERFIQHLEAQRKSYQDGDKASRAPYFAVIQSSGYGKSRMIDNMKKTQSEKYRVLYWSFGTASIPRGNVTVDEDFRVSNRAYLEAGFAVAIAQLINSEESGISRIEKPASSADHVTREAVRKKLEEVAKERTSTLLVIDEASKLLHEQTRDGVTYFRCLQSSLKAYFDLHADWLFTVVMATFPSLTLISPGSEFDNSFRPLPGSHEAGPLEPFILGASFRVHDRDENLLRKSVAKCHEREAIYAMGRPLWKAYLFEGIRAVDLLFYAKQKLMYERDIANITSGDKKWTLNQVLATLAARVCLSISPQSRHCSTLVAGHMGTAFSVSQDRLTIKMGFPSEPILALAARALWRESRNGLLQVISAMSGIFEYGTVDKGFKGEVIVRLLNLLAIDAATKRFGDEVREVSLRDFLKMFHRHGGGAIDEPFLESLGGRDDDRTINNPTILEKLGLVDTRMNATGGNDVENAAQTMLDGHVCFTHFTYLAKSATITHDLLGLAYRRTAAIVVEAGRRGIDLIIPIRLSGEENKFIGLVQQVKNRVSDVLEPLIDASNETTHHKVNHKYFLKSSEKESFQAAGVEMDQHWPSMLFAIGAVERGAAAAKHIERKRLRSDGRIDIVQFPCIVLTGLGYESFMDAGTNAALEKLRDFEFDLDDQKKGDIPLTYGLQP